MLSRAGASGLTPTASFHGPGDQHLAKSDQPALVDCGCRERHAPEAGASNGSPLPGRLRAAPHGLTSGPDFAVGAAYTWRAVVRRRAPPRGPLLEPCAPRARTKSLRHNLAERTVLLLPIRAPRGCCRARLAVCIAEMGGLRARGPGVTDRVRLVRPVACGLRLAACEYFRSDSGRPGLLGNRQFGPSKFARARCARRPNQPRSRHTVPLACMCISYRLAIAVLEIITYVAAPSYASPRAHAPYHTHAQPSRATRQQNIQPANDRSLALHPSMLPDSP